MTKYTVNVLHKHEYTDIEAENGAEATNIVMQAHNGGNFDENINITVVEQPMEIDDADSIDNQEDARQFAIDWQTWQATQSLSYGEMLEWSCLFNDLAKKFDLVEEFDENGLI